MYGLDYFRSGKYGSMIEDIVVQNGSFDEMLFLDDYHVSHRIAGMCRDYNDFIGAYSSFFVAFGDNEIREYWCNILI